MIKILRMPTFKKPHAPQQHAQRAEAQRNIWETARIAEKFDNYCVPAGEGFEVRYNGKVQLITGEVAARAQEMARVQGVDACDWILYIYTLEG